MTAARRTRKRYVWPAVLILALSGAVPGLLAATTEQIVVDRYTGLAIYGIDAVAYFTNHKPTAGRENFELRHAGAVWRFENAGNRAAFAADPHLDGFKGVVSDSGEGRWTALAAIEEGVPAPVLSAALFARFASRQEQSFAAQVNAALRNQFGGHAVRAVETAQAQTQDPRA